MNYDLPDLRLVAAIAESGSLTAGAERVHLAPSSASHRLSQLERNLGTALFARHARGLKATAAGEAVLRHARQVFAQLEQMHADLVPLSDAVNSQVRIFGNTNAVNCFLPSDLGDFLRRHPQIYVHLEEQPSPTIVEALLAGQVDIGVVAADVPLGGVTSRPYRRDRLVLILPPSHHLAGRQAIAFAEALDAPFVCLHAGSAIHSFMMHHASRLGARLDVRIQVRSFHAVCRMVAAGVGIGMVPRSSLGASSGELAILEISDAWAPRDLQLCTLPERALNSAAAALLEHLASAAQNEAA